MTDHAKVDRRPGEYDDWELRAIAASLIAEDADDICQVVMVVVTHPAQGGHQFAAATTIPADAAANAALLRHAADHLHGGCESCRRGNAKRRGHGD